ncbi:MULTISPECIES: hypothetical protein [unclassified Synechococcus]|uniref:hypothetical protein n=1 Tax=unclassified Synechococcus TaxID=2626047 RepID=UPI0021A2AEA9|nr:MULTISPECIES: hypothetical protein [unclassified Synechococcus]MCT0212443.1 hypothetical protein [Synechococcus sp. CS-1326]MCT0234626.1 hypothetical protein [Synechococcus sp. CS-1327]
MAASNMGITDTNNAYSANLPASLPSSTWPSMLWCSIKACGWKASEDILINLFDLNLELA